MELKAYSKYKDRNPEETVNKIREILSRNHIETQIVYTADQYAGACSNRILLSGTNAGSNGKGMGRIYALASGYAELMERIQNDWLVTRGYRIQFQKEFGFYHFPDEHLACAEDILEQDQGILFRWFCETGVRDDYDRKKLIGDCARLVYDRRDGKIPVVPFTDPVGKDKILLPVIFIKLLNGSNGMSAGNTFPEACVQGLSEVLERYAQWELLHKALTPPVIPDEWLHYAGVWELIEGIQESGRFRVIMFDCSLGKQLPVAGIMIADQQSGRFGFRLGAHPSMAVALERTLTEALQGQTAEEFAASNVVGSAEQVTDPYNLELLFRTGKGFLPAGLLSGHPAWDFNPWEITDREDNEHLLDKMLGLVQENGFRVLIRDNSWLGFPSCQIIVPGMSEISKGHYNSASSYTREFLFWKAMDHFPDLSEEEEAAVLFKAEPYLRYEDYMEPDLFKRPLMEGAMSKEKIFGCLFLKCKDYEKAAIMFRICRKRAVHKRGKLYWKAVEDYAVWRSIGMARENCIQLMKRLYPPAVSDRAADDTDPENILQRWFPKLKCFDCSNCEASERGMCLGSREKEVFHRIFTIQQKSSNSAKEQWQEEKE